LVLLVPSPIKRMIIHLVGQCKALKYLWNLLGSFVLQPPQPSPHIHYFPLQYSLLYYQKYCNITVIFKFSGSEV
jgi:hypothetical protein